MLTEAPEGPLHGVPIAVKDMFALPWRAPRDGSRAQPDRRRAGRVGRLPAPARRRRGDRRRHQHARVRRRLDRPHLGLRPVRQPVGPGALRRRVVRRLGGRRRRAPRRRRGRHRRRRLDPLSRRLLRRHRPEAHLGPGPVRRLHPRVLVDERRRARCAATPPTRGCSARRCSGGRSRAAARDGLRLGVVPRASGRTSTPRSQSSCRGRGRRAARGRHDRHRGGARGHRARAHRDGAAARRSRTPRPCRRRLAREHRAGAVADRPRARRSTEP